MDTAKFKWWDTSKGARKCAKVAILNTVEAIILSVITIRTGYVWVGVLCGMFTAFALRDWYDYINRLHADVKAELAWRGISNNVKNEDS